MKPSSPTVQPGLCLGWLEISDFLMRKAEMRNVIRNLCQAFANNKHIDQHAHDMQSDE